MHVRIVHFVPLLFVVFDNGYIVTIVWSRAVVKSDTIEFIVNRSGTLVNRVRKHKVIREVDERGDLFAPRAESFQMKRKNRRSFDDLHLLDSVDVLVASVN